MTVRMDLNADVGESFGTWVLGDDEAMLEVVTSANVACGFHAGDPTTIRRTVARAAYVKPHGALYTIAAVDEGQARAVVEAVLEYDPALPLLCQPGSVLHAVAEQADLTVVGEAFADRGYLPDGRLVPRSLAGALVTDADAVASRVLRIATEGTVVAVDGSLVALPARSVCTHGDTPGAVELAGAVRTRLEAAGITGAAFVTTEPTEPTEPTGTTRTQG